MTTPTDLIRAEMADCLLVGPSDLSTFEPAAITAALADGFIAQLGVGIGMDPRYRLVDDDRRIEQTVTLDSVYADIDAALADALLEDARRRDEAAELANLSARVGATLDQMCVDDVMSTPLADHHVVHYVTQSDANACGDWDRQQLGTRHPGRVTCPDCVATLPTSALAASGS